MRILIVEDEALIAMMAEDMVETLGHEICGIAASLRDALDAVALGGFDIVLLDMNLAGEDSAPVAAALDAIGLPYIYTTGYGSSGNGCAFGEARVLAKPYVLTELEAALNGSGTARPAMPHVVQLGTISIRSRVDSNLG